jgi:hypothetical protein
MKRDSVAPTTPHPSGSELVDAIADAARRAIEDLFSEHRDDDFYYVTLTTTGDAAPPVLSAWSRQALDEATQDAPDARLDLKWSYADSPLHLAGRHLRSPVRGTFLPVGVLGG